MFDVNRPTAALIASQRYADRIIATTFELEERLSLHPIYERDDAGTAIVVGYSEDEA